MTASTIAKEKNHDSDREIRRYPQEAPATGGKRKAKRPSSQSAKAAAGKSKRPPTAKRERRETELRLIKSEKKPQRSECGPAGNAAKKREAAVHNRKKKPTTAVHGAGRQNPRRPQQSRNPDRHSAPIRKKRPVPDARRRAVSPRRNRRFAVWKYILPVIAACTAAGFVLWYLSFDNLLPSDYIHVTYSGYDSRGTAALSIEGAEEYAAFLEDTEVRLLTENGNLKNGDILDIQFLYDEEKAKEEKLRIKEDSFQIEVNGLPEGRELTREMLFQDIRISYEGTAPELSVSVTNESSDPFLQTVAYEITDRKETYDIGDTFTVTAAFSEEEAVSYEYAVSAADYSQEFTVENADRYLRSASQLTQEQIDLLDETAVSLFGDANEYGLRIFSEANLMPIWINGKNTFKWSNPRLISAYLNVLKPEYFQTMQQSHNNDIKLVYKATLSQADGVGCTAEVVVQFHDLILKADGTYDLALDSGRIIAASFRDSHIRDLVTDTYAQEYEAEKLTLT